MTNFLSQLEFDFTIKRLPNVTFLVQAVSLPGMSMGTTEVNTPFKPIMLHGDRLVYDELTVTLKVDEDMLAWTEISDWMKGLTTPESFDQYNNLKIGEGLYSDASIMIMSNVKNPNIEFLFEDMFPIALGPIQFDTRSSDLEYVTVDVTFKFDSMKKK
ncbi:MAG: hypothetical protein COA84_13280 [Robiginitomaculum sp.]|nr:MAG: hypothetical protein COA84_13280 [Robiginitomaculum sp.]